jgi:hypothetical protein
MATAGSTLLKSHETLEGIPRLEVSHSAARGVLFGWSPNSANNGVRGRRSSCVSKLISTTDAWVAAPGVPLRLKAVIECSPVQGKAEIVVYSSNVCLCDSGQTPIPGCRFRCSKTRSAFRGLNPAIRFGCRRLCHSAMPTPRAALGGNRRVLAPCWPLLRYLRKLARWLRLGAFAKSR